MTLHHLFLHSPGTIVPARWREAFPDGQALDEPALLAQLARPAPQGRLVWLSATDLTWSNHLRRILQTAPDERVVLLSNEPQDPQGLHAINEGARGYAHAYAVPELFQEVALVISHGGLWIGPSLMQRLLAATDVAMSRRPATALSAPAAAALASLSAREAEVARAVAAGRSNKEVANLLHISERTVKAHLGAVFEKLGVRDRLQLALRLSAVPVPQA